MIYISGLSRSGTTLTQGLICNSPQTIGMTAECSYFRALMECYKQTKHPGFWNHAKHYFQSWEDFKDSHNAILSWYLGRVFDSLNEYKKIMVQKEPRLLGVWPELHDFYPKARYIIVMRDPRDIVASQLKRNPNTDLNQWLNFQLSNLQHAMKGPQENYWVRYEELVQYPERTLERLSDHLGIDIPLKEWDSVREDDSCSPLDGKMPESSSIGRWKDELSPYVEGKISVLQDWLIKTTGRDWFYGG